MSVNWGVGSSAGRWKGRMPKCPVCHRGEKVRAVEPDPSFPKLKKYCCDRCRIGWYNPVGRGATGRLHGTAESARAAYELPKKKP